MLMLLTRRLETVEEAYWEGFENQATRLGELDSAARDFFSLSLCHKTTSIIHDQGRLAYWRLSL